MKTIELGKSGLQVPRIAVGCMRINGMEEKAVASFVEKALELGTNFFDHADIYAGGECERLFSRAVGMTPSVREKLILQSKCGICPGKMFDFSKKHILEAVDGILERLHTEYLDILLLHRPDTLVEPEEVAEAFDLLKAAGKVRHFGVSNHKPLQIELLKKYVKQEISANQMQFGPAHATMVTAGLEANMRTDGAVDRDGGILDYCRLHDITMQAWSPFQYGFFEGVFLGNAKYAELNAVLEELAEGYGVTPTTIVAAWVLRHPARLQLVSGTTKESRLEEICKAADIALTREEWYRIYLAAGNILP